MKTAQQVLNELIIYIEQRKGNSLDGYQESNDKFIQQMYMGENTAYGMVLMEINKLLDQSPVAPQIKPCPDYFVYANSVYKCIGNDNNQYWLDDSGHAVGFDQSDCDELYLHPPVPVAPVASRSADADQLIEDILRPLVNSLGYGYENVNTVEGSMNDMLKIAKVAMKEYAASVVLPCVGEKEGSLQEKMNVFFANTTSEQLIKEFEKIGYKFVPLDESPHPIPEIKGGGEGEKEDWVKTEDGMPEKSKRVLILTTSGHVEVGYLTNEWQSDVTLMSMLDRGYNVTHWRYLPSPPNK